ncbi:PRP38-assoc multi-domain protein [Pyrenophora tritici-repentis]|nr:PRP38-assoc multi-domain protein [Pyrenophora tritici-repentis]
MAAWPSSDSYGAEQIPDKFFEKIPGGFFTPAEQKEIDKNRKTKGKSRKERRQSEEPSAMRNDSEYEREREQRRESDDVRRVLQKLLAGV